MMLATDMTRENEIASYAAADADDNGDGDHPG